MTTYLYRLWDDNDQLLYVGISKSAMARLTQHQRNKEWSQEIAKVTIESVGSRDEAQRLEKIAIQNEQPKYNIQHAGDQINLTNQLLDQWSKLNRMQRVAVIDQIKYLATYHFVDESVSSVRMRGALALIALDLDPDEDVPTFGGVA
jgi:excinuclease UvrABC nuclease subunit